MHLRQARNSYRTLTGHVSHGGSDFGANGQVDTNSPSGPPHSAVVGFPVTQQVEVSTAHVEVENLKGTFLCLPTLPYRSAPALRAICHWHLLLMSCHRSSHTGRPNSQLTLPSLNLLATDIPSASYAVRVGGDA
jgi:hypothetical protein